MLPKQIFVVVKSLIKFLLHLTNKHMLLQHYSSRRKTLKLIGGLVFGASMTAYFPRKVLSQANFPIDSIQPFAKMVQLLQ